MSRQRTWSHLHGFPRSPQYALREVNLETIFRNAWERWALLDRIAETDRGWRDRRGAAASS